MKSLYESIFDTNFEPTVDNTKVHPRSRAELEQIIDEHIKRLKPKPGDEVDLNWIDISGVDNLSYVFMGTNYIPIIDTWKIDHVGKFEGMFARNKHIVRSPLPILQEELQNGCYEAMFSGCTSLIEPPELPAKKLAVSCYDRMFSDCTSLEVAPKLPAQKLVVSCYWGMFEGCTSLKVAPELPAATVLSGSYSWMFSGCESLDDLPKINKQAWNKASGASWWNTFLGCSKIKAKYKLPKFMINT